MKNWRWNLLFSEQTYETLIKRILENTKANNLDTREGSVYMDAAAGHIIRTSKFLLSHKFINSKFIKIF